MTVLIDALNRQIDRSIYKNESTKEKMDLAARCEMIKKTTLVVMIVSPIFAFFLPYIFGMAACLTIGIVGYECFNIVDNLGDAAKQSAFAGKHGRMQSNVEMLFDSTLFANRWLQRSGDDSQDDLPQSMPPTNPFECLSSCGKI